MSSQVTGPPGPSLPGVFPNWIGAWVSGQPYAKNDGVTDGGAYFIALQPITSTTPPLQEVAGFWEQVAQPTGLNLVGLDYLNGPYGGVGNPRYWSDPGVGMGDNVSFNSSWYNVIDLGGNPYSTSGPTIANCRQPVDPGDPLTSAWWGANGPQGYGGDVQLNSGAGGFSVIPGGNFNYNAGTNSLQYLNFPGSDIWEITNVNYVENAISAAISSFTSSPFSYSGSAILSNYPGTDLDLFGGTLFYVPDPVNDYQPMSWGFIKTNCPTIVAPPANSSAAGVTGQVAFDASWFYYCYNTDQWARVVGNNLF